MNASPAGAQDLSQAFDAFTAATTRLEREYAMLRERLARLTAELEEKNRLLAEGALRERRLEAEALRHSRLAAMGEMAAMLAHEVRNPLGAMEHLRERPEAQRLARQVAQGISDLNHLVTNLLEFTRTHAVHGIVVERRYQAAAVAAYADPDLLRPVLLNLVRNAIQAMPGGGTLGVA